MNENARTALQFFMQRGYTRAQASGIVGNLAAESNLNPGNGVTGGGDKNTSHGIAQWREERLDGLKSFAKDRGVTPWDLNIQLEYVDHELKSSERGAHGKLMAAATPSEAAEAFVGFERPFGYTPTTPRKSDRWAVREENAIALFGGELTGSQALPASPVTYNDTAPRTPYTETEDHAAEKKSADKAYGFWKGAWEAAKDESVISWSFAGSTQLAPDPDFNPTPEMLKEVQTGLPEHLWGGFDYAHSEAHLRELRDRAVKDLEVETKLSGMGWTGTGLRLAAGILDPVNIPLAFIPMVGVPARAGRLARMGIGAAEAAAVNTAVEIPRYLNKPSATEDDLLWAAGFGLIIGGGVGALRRNPATQQEADALEETGRGLQRESNRLLAGREKLLQLEYQPQTLVTPPPRAPKDPLPDPNTPLITPPPARSAEPQPPPAVEAPSPAASEPVPEAVPEVAAPPVREPEPVRTPDPEPEPVKSVAATLRESPQYQTAAAIAKLAGAAGDTIRLSKLRAALKHLSRRDQDKALQELIENSDVDVERLPPKRRKESDELAALEIEGGEVDLVYLRVDLEYILSRLDGRRRDVNKIVFPGEGLPSHLEMSSMYKGRDRSRKPPDPRTPAEKAADYKRMRDEEEAAYVAPERTLEAPQVGTSSGEVEFSSMYVVSQRRRNEASAASGPAPDPSPKLPSIVPSEAARAAAKGKSADFMKWRKKSGADDEAKQAAVEAKAQAKADAEWKARRDAEEEAAEKAASKVATPNDPKVAEFFEGRTATDARLTREQTQSIFDRVLPDTRVQDLWQNTEKGFTAKGIILKLRDLSPFWSKSGRRDPDNPKFNHEDDILPDDEAFAAIRQRFADDVEPQGPDPEPTPAAAAPNAASSASSAPPPTTSQHVAELKELKSARLKDEGMPEAEDAYLQRLFALKADKSIKREEMVAIVNGVQGFDIAPSTPRNKAIGELIVSRRWVVENHRRAASIGRPLKEPNADLPPSSGGFGNSVGAAAAPTRLPLRESVDLWTNAAVQEAIDRSFAGFMRFDLAGRTKSSANALTRALGAAFVEDAVGNANRKSATVFSASERQRQLHGRMTTRVEKDYASAYNEMAKRLGWNWKQRNEGHQDFREQITEFIRNRDTTREFDPAVTKVGEAMRKGYNDYLEILKDPGKLTGTTRRAVPGAAETEFDPNYSPRVPDFERIDDLTTRFGDDRLQGLIYHSIKEWQGGLISDVLANKIATGYLRRLRETSAGMTDVDRAFSGGDLHGMREALDQLGLAGDEVETIISHFSVKDTDRGVSASRLKRRTLFDESFSMELRNKNGGVETVRITDLFVKDAMHLFHSYSRTMSGWAAMANVRVRNPLFDPDDPEGAAEFLIDGITSRGEMNGRINDVRAVWDEMDPSSKRTRDSDVERLQFMFDRIIGVPDKFDSTKLGRFMQGVRDYNVIRLMGQVGFAQLGEVGQTLGQLGLKASWAGMPSLRALTRNAATGKLNDELAEELSDNIGFGDDFFKGQFRQRQDEGSAAINPTDGTRTNAGKLGRRVEDTLYTGKRYTSLLSGMTVVDTISRRWAAAAVVQKIARAAVGKDTLNVNRMRALGIEDDAVMERIFAQIRTHSVMDNGKLKKVNFADWTDQEALSVFRDATWRWSRRIIQENDLGQTSILLSNPAMRVVTQFRTFMLGAWTKQFLHGVNMRDWNTFASFSATMALGGAAYIGQTHLQSIGRSDRDKWLKKRLAPEKIVAATFQRSGWSSLWPMLLDTPVTFSGNDPLFDTRASGQYSDIWFGNPTLGLVNDVQDATRGLTTGRVSQADMRSLARPGPWQNVMPFALTYNALISGLPEHDPYTRKKR